MFVKVISMSVIGMESYPVYVEVDTSQGLPQFATVGLPTLRLRKAETGSKPPSKIPVIVFPAVMSPSIWLPPILKKKERVLICPLPWAFWPRKN